VFVRYVHFKGGFVGTMCLDVCVVRGLAAPCGILRGLAVNVRELAGIMLAFA
jgi:hypothetical protein